MTTVLDAPGAPADLFVMSGRPPDCGRDDRAGRGRPSPRPVEARAVVGLTLVVYLTIAMLLDFHYLILPGDAMSRTANGFYVLFSRDPHLGAIGFVWTPLTSVVDLFFLLFKGVWPALLTHDVAGSLTSVLAMTGAVHQLRALLAEWNVSRGPRLALTAMFAFNPMILYYSANGMSEAIYVFTLVAATRYLVTWLNSGRTRALVFSAAMLALAFLGRNEAVAAAATGGVLVFAVSYRSAGARTGRSRIRTAFSDMVVFLLPFSVTFVGWAVTGYVLTGKLLAQFQANALQVSIAGVARSSSSARLLHEFTALFYIAPLLPVVLILAGFTAIRRRDVQPLGVISLLGGSLAFSLLSYFDAKIFPWFRFYILAVPIEILLCGYLVAKLLGPTAEPWRFSVPGWLRRPAIGTLVGMGIAVALIGPSIPTTAEAMLNPVVSPETTQDLGFVFHAHPSAADRQSQEHYAHIVAISSYIAGLHLPEGDILLDDSDSCAPEIIITSASPRVFVIPNDRDFQRVLADPLTFHDRYLLLPQPSGLNAYDAVSQQFPGVYDGQSRIARVDHTFKSGGLCPAYRLLRVIGHPSSA